MKTKSGFEFAFDPARLDNMELLDALGELQQGGDDITVMTRLIDLMLGPGLKRQLYDHVRTEDGRVPVAAFSAEVTEIFNLLQDDLKKS